MARACWWPTLWPPTAGLGTNTPGTWAAPTPTCPTSCRRPARRTLISTSTGPTTTTSTRTTTAGWRWLTHRIALRQWSRSQAQGALYDPPRYLTGADRDISGELQQR